VNKTILIVEDEAHVRAVFESALVANGYRVLLADTLEIGWNLFGRENPDLVIIDIVLPDGSGLELCGKIRQHKTLNRTPVIILTGKHEIESKTAGFRAGADQYLVKPLPPQELVLWVEALLRRLSYEEGDEDLLDAGGCRIDLKSRLVSFKGQTFDLTNKEFDLLYCLVKKRPQVLSRKFLLSRLWHTITVDNVVNTHINNLRRKLPQELADKIQTVPGKGFRFMA